MKTKKYKKHIARSKILVQYYPYFLVNWTGWSSTTKYFDIQFPLRLRFTHLFTWSPPVPAAPERGTRQTWRCE